MRVRVVISYDFSEDDRRTVNAYYGKPGLASCKSLKQLINMFGEPTNENWTGDLMVRQGITANE